MRQLYKRSRDLLNESLALFRKFGDTYHEGVALGNLGNLHSALKESTAALDCFNQALQIARLTKDVRSEANTLFNSSLEYHNSGDLRSAMANATAALEIFEAIEDPNAPRVRALIIQWQSSDDDLS